MSLQWNFVAAFLYVEIFVIILFLAPFISATRWKKIFNSNLVAILANWSYFAFNVMIVVLVVLLFDAIRELRKYSIADFSPHELSNNPQAETLVKMKLFRAQRNLYIAGFALLLFVVLKRLVIVISSQATLQAKYEASLKQAESATRTAQQLMDGRDAPSDRSSAAEEARRSGSVQQVVEAAVDRNNVEKELSAVRIELQRAREELHHSNLDLATLRKQAAQTNQAYDGLMSEHESVQKQLAQLEAELAGGSSSASHLKKDS